MDHSHFMLTLDTTGPDIEVYMPTYATPDVDNEIIVQGSELLAPQQDFYFVDALGERHDLIFEYKGDHFVGLVRFNQFALGVATFYAQVRDEVFNPSALAAQAINIQGGATLTICADFKQRAVDTSYQVRQINTAVACRQIEVNIA